MDELLRIVARGDVRWGDSIAALLATGESLYFVDAFVVTVGSNTVHGGVCGAPLRAQSSLM